MSSPEVTVVIASYNAVATIGRCLMSLREQSTKRPFEVILVDSSTDGTAGLVKERFPEVRVLSFPERKYCGDARNAAISVANGAIIAFLDADCTAGTRFVEETAVAHQSPYLAVGGVIEHGGPDTPTGWAYYFCEFSRWMPGHHAPVIDEVAGAALSIKREAFVRYGPFIEGTYSSDTAFLWKLTRDGGVVLVAPDITVRHFTTHAAGGFLAHEVAHGRQFAQVRISETQMGIFARVALAVGCPALPMLLFSRTLVRVAARRTHRRNFIKAAPLVFLGHAAWSLGEFLACLGGSGIRKGKRAGQAEPSTAGA
jgi:GT2 family glycosyltransferase